MTNIYIVTDFVDPKRLIADKYGYNQQIMMTTLDKESALKLALDHYEDNKKYYDDPNFTDRVYVTEYEDYDYPEPNSGKDIWDSAEFKATMIYEDDGLPIDIDSEKEE